MEQITYTEYEMAVAGVAKYAAIINLRAKLEVSYDEYEKAAIAIAEATDIIKRFSKQIAKRSADAIELSNHIAHNGCTPNSDLSDTDISASLFNFLEACHQPKFGKVKDLEAFSISEIKTYKRFGPAKEQELLSMIIFFNLNGRP